MGTAPAVVGVRIDAAVEHVGSGDTHKVVVPDFADDDAGLLFADAYASGVI